MCVCVDVPIVRCSQSLGSCMHLENYHFSCYLHFVKIEPYRYIIDKQYIRDSAKGIRLLDKESIEIGSAIKVGTAYADKGFGAVCMIIL